MNKLNDHKTYIVNGIQGLKLSSKVGSENKSKSRPSSSRLASRTASQGKLSRPSTSHTPGASSTRTSSSTLVNDSQILEDNCDADVIIHVFDENRNAKRDFYCKKGLLLSEMSYFDNHMKEIKKTYDIDVHCDMDVFEWLMNHITRRNVELEVKSVVSILISSSFLQMNKLETQCLAFIHANINQVIQVPIDFRCIPAKTVKILAQLFTTSDLAEIHDPKSKIEDQLYMYNISNLVSPLVKCKLCSKVICLDFYTDIKCNLGDLELDGSGNIIRNHELDDVFDPNEYVVALYLSCKSWKHVYWRIWGLQTKFECKECQRIYPASEFLQCRKHIFNPIYNSEGLKGCGIYPCCKRPVLKFMPFGGNQGCHYAPHIPIRTSGKTYDIFLKISKFISWRSPSDDNEPIKITATDILIPEKKLFKKWDFVTKTSVIQNQTKSDSKNTAKVSSTQLQFDQRRKDEQKQKEWKNYILQKRQYIQI